MISYFNDDFPGEGLTQLRVEERNQKVNDVTTSKKLIIIRGLERGSQESQHPDTFLAVVVGRRIEQAVEHRNILQVDDGSLKTKLVHVWVHEMVRFQQSRERLVHKGGDNGWDPRWSNAVVALNDCIPESVHQQQQLVLLSHS